MNTKKQSTASVAKVQEVCIDLPGESVQCWRTSDNVKVILRKHRDVIFDINLRKNAIYTVESSAQFYSPREKKLLKKATFFDGERFNIWVGREFQGGLVLRYNDVVLGRYEVNKLDSRTYGADPKVKPEPLMVIMGEKQEPEPFVCTASDPFGIGRTQLALLPTIEPKLPFLKGVGSQFDYVYPKEAPEVQEYAVVAEVKPEEIQPQVLAQLEKGAVTGRPGEIFVAPKKKDEDSPIYRGISAAAAVIGNVMTANWFKETAGYLQEHWRSLDKITMTVRIEKKAKGKYRAVIKGKPLPQYIAQSLGAGKDAKVTHQRSALGSKGSSFIDGGFARSGKAGYGGARRIMLTAADNFKGGLKIQIIGTVIDLFVDANSVWGDDKGSRDLSEFLGRAGVSIAKAGATAAIGSIFAAAGVTLVTAGAVVLGATAAPVFAVVAVVVGGYILAATIVDYVDNKLEIKETVANIAR